MDFPLQHMDIRNFPPPKIPLSPVLDNNHAPNSHPEKTPSIFDAKYKLNTTSGRAALSIALEECGTTNEHEVLIPSYHCESMISPTLRLNAKAIFYRINSDTSPNLTDLKKKISPKTKAIIVTHFFGFTEDLTDIRQLCDTHNICLIEDCAHAFFGQINRQSVGTVGDYAIASTMKFFPVFDGGILASQKYNLQNISLKQPSLSFQVKSWINAVERALAYKRLGARGKVLNTLLSIKTTCWSFIKGLRPQESVVTSSPGSSEGGFGLDENWIYVKSTVSSQKTIINADYSDISKKRRAYYELLDDALRDLPSCEPLFKNLPHDVVPLVYPLKFQCPEQYFSALKEKGVPIWRFGEYLDEKVTPEEFPISRELSETVFQFPCHQSLTQDELDWMIKTIKETIKS
ncbi:MAG: DegT/DnrJ/EryC1/StrS aminotransferase family protein [Alphaproteobacteria bacterium]|nr:DegT/DnrJ/EryC1/StrS aminotransferase family protein [Alphaproteobacteria bacterium]